MKTVHCLFVICLSIWTSSGVAETGRRNFVFILADDLGIMDLGVEGSTFYESPHIDRLARSGMRFRRGYATCQVCSPSRASIMTGKYPTRLGITTWIGDRAGRDWKRNTKLLPAAYTRRLDHGEITLAEALRAAGYRTFFAGKWHLGDEGSWPEDHGFEVNKGGWDRGSPAGGYFAPYVNPRLESGPDGESLPLRLGRETVRFIEDHKNEPFLAYLSFYSVHGPIQTTQKKWRKYQKKAAQNPHDGARFIVDRRLPVRQVQDCPIYAGMIEAMDEAVGMVLDKLEALGLSQNTVVCFTSDNGGVSSGDAFSSSMLPYRGGKGRQWEGGIREPYYIRVPGVTTPGSVCDVPVTGTDFYPTILELAGLPLNPRQHRDGVSLVPLLHGREIEQRDLFWHYPHYGNQGGEPSSIICSGPWKLIHYWEDGRDELYHILRDIGEQHDLAAQHAEKRDTLRGKLDRWLEEVGANLPTLNQLYDAQRAQRQAVTMRTRTLQNLEKRHADYVRADWRPDKTWWGSLPATQD
ncbi:MAG: sulfatase [Planctomycetes bacterium]|nr:sulfatase [Planctomycetota bacterium]